MEKDKIVSTATLIKKNIKKISKNVYARSLALIVLALILIRIISFRETDVLDNEDGRGSMGAGIAKGGNGALGYGKLHRKGGTPPATTNPGILNEMLDLDRSLYKTDKKIVIVLGANIEGGVKNWKEPREWVIERASVSNKKEYANRHGYQLVIKDLTRKKRYSHEFREAWGKFDALRGAMKDYPNSEWFWYLDLNTLIMEPQISLEDWIFSRLDEAHRDLTYFNPHAIPTEMPYLENDDSIDFIVAQDCTGFNLNSFFVRKSDWSNLLLDVIFDPIFYKQMHIKWERDESHSLEYLYSTQPWVRSRIGFLPNRRFNSLARGACLDIAEIDQGNFIYNETGRDFLVNMNHCRKYGNCFDEMEFFKELSKFLHKGWFSSWF